MRTRALSAAPVVALVVALVGCGRDADSATDPRPDGAADAALDAPKRTCTWEFARVTYYTDGGETKTDVRAIECAEGQQCPIDGCNACFCTFDDAGKERHVCTTLPPC